MHSHTALKNLYTLILVFPLLFPAAGIPFAAPVQGGNADPVRLEQFDLLTSSSGWALLDRRLFWTSDAGRTWQETDLPMPDDAAVQDVEFINRTTGRVLWTTIGREGSAHFELAQTSDGGMTWSTRLLSLFGSAEPASQVEKAEMGWFDVQSGWISVKQVSGSNFSLGILFKTSDGGRTWSRSALPVADHVVFHESQIGWAVGGPAGGQVYRTRDGGASWQSAGLGAAASPHASAYVPFYADGRALLVMTGMEPENSLNVYALEEARDEWLPLGQVRLDSEPGIVGLSILDGQNFVAVIPGTGDIVRMRDGKLSVTTGQDGRSTSIVQLDMVTPESGWAKSVESNCVADSTSAGQSAAVVCSSATRLLQTSDGGRTWQVLALPSVQSDGVLPGPAGSGQTTMNTLANPGNTRVFIGQGFDKCEIPTLPQMQTWGSGSPYRTVNLYIGGSSRACQNNALSASYLDQLYQQGWMFIPTWVGPQAPCTGFWSRMDSDVTVAYYEGVNEANLAVERLAELGLTFPDKSGSVIYYDIEHYGTDTACRDAVNAFMDGWVAQIHARGNLAGVYGSTLCDTALSDFRFIANVPDVIWPARWYHNAGAGFYDPTASVWNLGNCVPNTAWASHQRIRQYEGGHFETWGDLTLEIDSNVLDGVVAFPYVAPLVQEITRLDPDPADTASVRFAVKISEAVAGVDLTDFLLTTSGITGASITTVDGSGDIYTVTVSTGLGNGTIRLDLKDDDSIKNASHVPLGGSGPDNGSFAFGETYTIHKVATFADVPITYWAWDWIERLYRARVTGGCGGSYYCPENPVTRAQMAIFLERGMNGEAYTPPPATGAVFTDIPASYWAAAWIEQLSADGITSGCGGGNYCPEGMVTRAQMAAFLLRAKHGRTYTPPAAAGVFSDVPVDHWAAAWIEQLAAEQITSGCGTGIYCPESPVTRAQMAVFLVRTFNLP